MDDHRLLADWVEQCQLWVNAQMALHRGFARPLAVNLREAMKPYFSQATLQSARLRWVRKVEYPDFFLEGARKAGARAPADLRAMDGITFGRIILLAQSPRSTRRSRHALVFHELVHVVQYELLGIEEFVRRFARAIYEFDYEAIPIEVQAYELQSRFEGTRRKRFSVEDEVVNKLDEL